VLSVLTAVAVSMSLIPAMLLNAPDFFLARTQTVLEDSQEKDDCEDQDSDPLIQKKHCKLIVVEVRLFVVFIFGDYFLVMS
jgi:hypothetical protein